MKTAFAFLFAIVAAASSMSHAQGTAVSLGSLTHDTSLPVEVTADNLSVANEEGQAVFDGNVVAIQGPMRLAAARVEVTYSESEEDDSTTIERMFATGGVTYANGPDAAESTEAVYDPEGGTLLMTGSVLLTQGSTAVSGERLTIDLEAGTGVMEGRVRTTFQSGNN